MSRGFVKEDDQEETPLIPPRASLPASAVNYVTPTGLEMLKKERETLQKQRENMNISSEKERRIALMVLQGKLNLLNERIASTRVLDPKEQPMNEVRFGATVTYKILPSSKHNTFQIVGVDEADIKKQKIAFVSPIAMALTGHKKTEIVEFNLGVETKRVEIVEIKY